MSHDYLSAKDYDFSQGRYPPYVSQEPALDSLVTPNNRPQQNVQMAVTGSMTAPMGIVPPSAQDLLHPPSTYA